MKKIFTILYFLFSLSIVESYATVGMFASGVNINGTNYTANTTLSGTYAANALTLVGVGTSTWQNSGDDVCTAYVGYSIASTAVSGTITMAYVTNGPSAGDKVFANPAANINISNLANGTYTLNCDYYAFGRYGGVTCFGSTNPFTTVTLKTISITFTISTPLPVTLNEFLSHKKSDHVQLAWTTETESNSSHFEIEKSINGISWSKLADVKAAGNSQRRQNYDFTDISPAQGVNYYRLKMVDRDATFKYSKVISVNFGKNNSASISPNPVSDRLHVTFSEDNTSATVEIFNLSGQSVQRQTLENNSLDVSLLNSGLYFIQITDDNGQVLAREKLIKN
jgi:Secretion system C-terminal sorting domain